MSIRIVFQITDTKPTPFKHPYCTPNYDLYFIVDRGHWHGLTSSHPITEVKQP